eukprot:CAMPEP_0172744514 /NCGR_PEP_ID=MMETSP1074-20121228/135393_1 /TAXON_ID=2916 /ORGANISM="Ceratium fusus, Strain PA161109" /LENGTH=420 /DNA_ID=CAMNT_0013575489 /DNA_START=26 /DNA_END=1288 /DNA_ORIENTATION=+
MAGRLAQVEQLNKNLSAKVAEQAQEIEELRAQLQAAQGLSDGQCDSGVAPTEAGLRAERDSLFQQLKDARHFLEQYGLQWVPGAGGDGDKDSASDTPASKAKNVVSLAEKLSRPSPQAGVSVNIKVIDSRVQGLNAMLEEERDASGKASGAKLGQLSDGDLPQPLTFFRDGIKMSDYAFLQYESRTAQDLIKDVLDGFFPRMLKDRYPDGVVMKVVDRTGNDFKSWLRDFARDDPDLTAGGERLRPVCGGRAIRSKADEQTPGERLLEKLPERVVRDGKVFEIRGPLRERLAPGTVTASVPQASSGVQAAQASSSKQQEVVLLDEGRDPQKPVAQLQVKLEGGQRVHLRLEQHATIGSLWAALERWRAAHKIARACAGGKTCCLRTAFPPKAYTVHSQTLLEAGLTPSATLFVSVEASES